MTTRHSTLLAIAGACLLAGCGPTPEELYASARQAFAAHDYQGARSDLTALLREEPRDAEALELLARAQLALDDGPGAATSLQHLAAMGKLPADAAILQGQAAILSGQPKLALDRVASVNSAEASRIRGLAYITLQQPDRAAAEFETGLSAPGPKASLEAIYARFLLDKGDIGGAQRFVSNALRENAVERVALQVSGHIAMAEKRFNEAEQRYSRVLDIYHDDRTALFGKIAALGEQRKLKEIEPLLKKAEQIASDNPQVMFFKAMLAAERHDWQRVRAILQPKETELATMPQMQLLYGKALLELGQVEQARAYLSPLLLDAPDNRELRLTLAKAQMGGHDPYAATETLRPFFELPDATVEELSLLASAARAAGDPNEVVYAARLLTARQQRETAPANSSATPETASEPRRQ